MRKSQDMGKVGYLGAMYCMYRILCGTIHVEIFHRISENFDMMVALEEISGDHQSHKDLSSGDHECQH